MRLQFLKIWAVQLTLLMMMSNALWAGDKKENHENQFLSNVRQLIYEGKRSGEGYFSGDGKALIFQAEREPGNPFFQIYVLDLETGDSQRVSPGIGKTTCAFFRPGGDHVLFASTHLDPDAKTKQSAEIEFRASGKSRRYDWDYDEFMDIFSARRDGTQLTRLTSAKGYDAEGSYSPDGKKIVFCSLRDVYQNQKLTDEEKKRLQMDPAYFAELYLMDADGANPIRLTDWAGYDGGPFFTPDGKRIVWRHFEENGAIADVFTMKPDGTDIRRITDFQAMSWAPIFHPSGEYLIFTSNKLGFSNFELFLVDAQGQHEPVQVTFTDGFDGLGVFSPDGKSMSWTSKRTPDNRSQMFLAHWNHEAALRALEASPLRKIKLSQKISKTDLNAIVSYLASDDLQGRLTGSEGIKKAADYITERFQEFGLQPLGDDDSYFQEFEYTAGVKLTPGKNHLKISSKTHPQQRDFEVDKDFRPLAFTANSEVEGDVVFAGYGLTLPGKLGEGYNSYEDVDVQDKIVLLLRYVPEDVDMERRQTLNRYAGLRYKAMLARNQGAKALLVVTGPNSPKAGELANLSFDFGGVSSGIVALSISGEVAEELFTAAGKDLKTVQTELDRENPHYEGHFPLTNVRVKISASIDRIKKADRNVIGFLPPNASDKVDEVIVVGAHYDHIGFGEIGSMARKGEEGKVHNGADDNASGSASVLELAASLAALQSQQLNEFRKGIIFALWSAEELGIIGSANFVKNPPVALDKIKAYVNFDMVGRLRDNKLILQGLGSSSVWRKLIEKRNVAAGFALVVQDDPYQPTDVSAFYPKGVPVLSFFTGSHEDYNRPTDDAETLNYTGMERIARFAQTIILDLIKSTESPDYVKVERTKQEQGGREGLRAYLGTIPDYVGGDSEGVKLSGVRAGGPADKAGLKGEDLIIKFGGKKITNIYDYTYALDAIKIGEPVEVVVLRDGEEITLTVVPEARK